MTTTIARRVAIGAVRDRKVGVTLTEEEEKKLQALAAQHELTLSDVLRMLILAAELDR